MSVSQRLNLISSHLLSNFSIPHDDSLDKYRLKGSFSAGPSLRSFYFFVGSDLYQELIEAHISLKSMENHPNAPLTKTAQREKLIQRLFDLKKTLSVTREQHLTVPLRAFIFSQVNLVYDMPLLIKIGVHYGLYSDALEYLGTSKHHSAIVQGLAMNDLGCFALTELGHGSNVSKLETTATYIKETKEFVINSPTPTATKWWIGGSGQTCNKCVVFAQLYVDGVHQGLQGFLIDLRDRITLKVTEGIIIGDCGHKTGNNSIDNGFLIFKGLKVPYDSLLDRLSSIDSNGKFHTTIKKKEKRLGIMMSSLMRGRACCVSSSQGNLQNALTIAIRYSAVRKQFSQGPGPENSILDYSLTRTRLLPHLSNLFANLAASEFIFTKYKSIREKMAQDYEAVEVTEFHAALSALKALTTDWAFEGLHECRKICGGLGYSHFAAIGNLIKDHDVNLTWEGDNNVLLQQTSAFIVKQSLKAMQGKKIEGESLRIINMDVEALHREKPTVEFSVNGLLSCFRHLLNLLLHKGLAVLQHNSGVYSEYFEVWNYSQPILQKLARVYGILEIAGHWKTRSSAWMENSKETSELTEKILRLFLVDKLKNYFAELLAEGFFEPVDCEKLESLWYTLCVELGDEAVRIIDAISYPDESHGSVLGKKDGQVYSHLIRAVEGQKDCYEQSAEVIQDIQSLFK